MSQYTRAANLYLSAVVGFGAALVILSVWYDWGGAIPWNAFITLTVLGAISHLYPVRSASENVFYVVANIFTLAGAILLTPATLTLLCSLVILPYTLTMRGRRPRIWVRYAFNSAQTVIAALAAHLLMRLLGGPDLHSPTGILVIMLAATGYTLLQALLVTIVIALNNRIPLRQVGTLAPKALLAEGIQPFMGIVLAGLWTSLPWVLWVLPIPVLITYRLVRQVHLVQSDEMDSKTGLYSYKYFQHMLSEELTRSMRVNRPLAVIFADMDFLRNVNNQWGHLAGDEVLKQLAAILRSRIRKDDICARFGGEEFVIMLPGTDLDEAYYIAEQLRSAVAAWPFAICGGRTISCTISLGVACAPRHGSDLTGLLHVADSALYMAKAQGRNRAVRAGTLIPAAEVAAAIAVPCVPDTPAPAPEPRASTPGAAVRTASLLATGLLAGVIAGGLLTLLIAAVGLKSIALWQVLIVSASAVLAELSKTRIYEGGEQKITVTLSSAVTMAAAVTGGLPLAATASLVAAVTYLLTRRPKSLDKILFNLFNHVLSAGIAALVFAIIAGPGRGTATPLSLIGALVASVVFYHVNSGLVACMVSLKTGSNFLELWKGNLWVAIPLIFLGLIGAFTGMAYQRVGWEGVVLFTVPVLILRLSFTVYADKTQCSIRALERAKTEVEQAHTKQQQTLEELIHTVAAIIDARDNSTYGHSKQVARYSVALAHMLSLDQAATEEIRIAALLHDVGKVGVPEAILKKPARLTDEEYVAIKEHAALGERILSEVSALGQIARIVGEHHEKYDGSGYPRGKVGTETSLGGRIIAVADALDSILSDRPYSRGRSLEEALAEIQRCAGSHFDPQVVAALLRIVEEQGTHGFVNSARSGGQQASGGLEGVAD